MRYFSRGFTLIELMIVVAIIAILAAIALPTYGAYREAAAERACLAEAKNYASWVMAALHNNDAPPPPTQSACQSITDASGFTDLNHTIAGTPSPPGGRTISCNLATGGNCILN